MNIIKNMFFKTQKVGEKSFIYIWFARRITVLASKKRKYDQTMKIELSCVLSFEMYVINSKVCKFRKKRKDMKLTECSFENLGQIRVINKRNIHHCEIIRRWIKYLNFWNRTFSIQQEFPVKISCLLFDYVAISKFFLFVGNLWNIIHILCYCYVIVCAPSHWFFIEKNTARFEFVFWYSSNIKYHIDRQKWSVSIFFWNIKFVWNRKNRDTLTEFHHVFSRPLNGIEAFILSHFQWWNENWQTKENERENWNTNEKKWAPKNYL